AGKNLLAKQADFRSFYTCLTASRCKGFERILIKGLAPIFDIIRSNSLYVLDFLFVQQSLFNVPDFLGQTVKIVYVFLIYFLVSAIFYTANNVAYSSLTSFMTNDKRDRVSLGSIRFIFANVAVLSITTFTTFIVDAFGGGQQGWTGTAALYTLLCAVPLMITGWFTKERNVAKAKNEGQKTSFLLILKVLFTNKHFILALILYLLWYLRQTENGIRVYYATYIFDNADVMSFLSMAALLPMVIGLFF